LRINSEDAVLIMTTLKCGAGVKNSDASAKRFSDRHGASQADVEKLCLYLR
jgi:hypothetical protein